jgi:lycopene beta-cyclase
LKLHYDYIIAGGGASGLMVAYRMAADSFFDQKSILILDQEIKSADDRTWCYWEEGIGEWDDILTHQWADIYFGSDTIQQKYSLGTFKYKQIRSSLFYKKIQYQLSKKPQFTIRQGRVLKIKEDENKVTVSTVEHTYTCDKVLSSLLDLSAIKNTKEPFLKQHFIGWFIKTEKPYFDDKVATFMDFKLPQEGNTRFMYVLPTSPYEALVEYTLFSADVLQDSEYENAIKTYIAHLGVETYIITDKERGVIPMTTHRFEKENTARTTYIGSAGGWSKACTGFTFMNTSRKSHDVIKALKSNKIYKPSLDRYWYYDRIFLDVLERKNKLGSKVFSSIFQFNKVQDVLSFLDSKGSFTKDLSIMWTTKPTWEFVYSFVRCIPRFTKTLFWG